ncbi:TrbC/VirB2 family protein [Sphingopyxis sp. OAS728]|uniref:TrbC/VirB2 family protein n=1 Tax=Sphingopyxis sp. OAS728 TaxID=2663823 RepID=UPI001789A7ED|nr:TrbC/VirB2 family protein [Sphingopyxis sp. OAS728]
MYLPTLSLADPPVDSPIEDAIHWIQSVALGSTATMIAVIAVAAIGLLMLSGRLELRRGIVVVIGCFVLFGASGIVAVLTGSASSVRDRPVVTSNSQRPPTVIPLPGSSTSNYDPYAGASVPSQH